MTLIKLKDDSVEYVLPQHWTEYEEFRVVYDNHFDVRIKFKNSSQFRYYTERPFLDEEAISDTIEYLFSDTSKFSELTAEEFKENLKKYLDSL